MSDEESQIGISNRLIGVPTEVDKEPSVKKNSFSCPHCDTYTHQYWYDVGVNRKDNDQRPYIIDDDFIELWNDIIDDLNNSTETRRLHAELLPEYERQKKKYDSGQFFIESDSENRVFGRIVGNLFISECYTCHKLALWVHKRLVFPRRKTGIIPNPDMPDDVRLDFEEARAILEYSPRASCALLRLSIEKLCNYLDATGTSLDSRIRNLVQNGLSEKVRKALDSVRVIGNEAVHPGSLDLRDDRDTATILFRLVNIVVEQMISESKKIDAVYEMIPQSKKDEMDRKDGRGNAKNQV